MHLSEQNRKLWERVSAFDLAEYRFNYGFALRLATENKWSIEFTDAAIMEYKKFMFLAAISEEMMAPSEIVDVVWHLHLIYSESYQSLCMVLGKDIRHIPSRKQEEERAGFEAAQLLTQKVYEAVFGPMPQGFWKDKAMYDSLQLTRSSYSAVNVILLALALLPILIAGAYFLLLPVYRGIDSIYFLPAYCGLGIIIFFMLRQHNQQQFKRLVGQAAPYSFLFQLGSLELITLKSGTVKVCIHALSNELVVNGHIAVEHLNRLSVIRVPGPGQTAKQKLFEVFNQFEGPIVYNRVISKAMHTPFFQMIQNFADHLLYYINTSKEYIRITGRNCCYWGIFLTLGIVRILTGLSAGKPVTYMLFFVLAFTALAAYLLKGLKYQYLNTVLSHHYLNVIEVPEPENALQRDYLKSGKLALTAAFMPLVGANIIMGRDNHDNTSASSCGTSSCSSSCSSGCGGCGGD